MDLNATSDARKRDTRDKIALGSLVMKAGLHHEKQALLLGLLIDARRRMACDEQEEARLLAIGMEATSRDDK